MSGSLANWPEGVGRIVLDAVDSTNAEALRQAATLDRPTWFLARRQLQGRGRRGRDWLDPPGNFAATLLMRPKGDAARAALHSFVAALAVRDACLSLVGPNAGMALKWPNDVLLNGGKLAGILLEGSGAGRGVTQLAIGIGVNLAAAPPPDPAARSGAPQPVSLAGETGLQVTPEAFLDHLAPAFARWAGQLQAEGFAPLREAWLAHAARLGDTVTARTGTDSLTGRFETLDETGALVLMTSQGRRVITAADVFFG